MSLVDDISLGRYLTNCQILVWVESFFPAFVLGHSHILRNYKWVHLCSTILSMLEDVSQIGFQIIRKSSNFSVYFQGPPHVRLHITLICDFLSSTRSVFQGILWQWRTCIPPSHLDIIISGHCLKFISMVAKETMVLHIPISSKGLSTSFFRTRKAMINCRIHIIPTICGFPNVPFCSMTRNKTWFYF